MTDDPTRGGVGTDDLGGQPSAGAPEEPGGTPEAGASPEVAASAQAGGRVGGRVGGRQASLWGDAWRDLRRNPVFIVSGLVILVVVIMAVFPQLFTHTNANTQNCDLAVSREGPTAGHPFGFDVQGCDFYSNVIYGARPSITIGVTVTLAALAIALVLGSLAAFYGGIVDSVIARVTDIFFGLPLILGATVILVSFPVRNLWTVCLVLVIFGWTTMTRLMRSSVLAAKDMDYVSAARALGASDVRILTRHILPNAIAPVMIYATLHVGVVIGAEAALTFLGVGLQPPAISWGLQLNVARTYFQDTPHLLLFPSVFLSVTVLAFILLGDAVRDAFDPKLR